MLVAWIHFFANLIIALALMRLAEVWLVEQYGAENPMARALAFIHG